MVIYRGESQFLSHDDIVLTIGSFDGIHSGHRHVIAQLKEQAEQMGAKSMVVSLSPHPRFVLGNDENFALIYGEKEKYHLLNELGVDFLYSIEFTRQVAQMTAKEFITTYLSSKFKVSALLMGYNNHFGSDRAAFNDLLPLASSLGFDLLPLTEQRLLGDKVSSTIVRKALQKGLVEDVARYLGNSYFVISDIEQGKLTTNLKDRLLPLDGCYFVKLNDSNYDTCTANVYDGKIELDTPIHAKEAIVSFIKNK